MDNQEQQGMKRPDNDSREWKLIEKVVMEMQVEQKRSRRWGIFFKLVTFAYLIGILMLFRLPGEVSTKPAASYAAIVEVNGPIAVDSDASADLIIGGIRQAFKDPKALGLILRINSPGGSPVQSGYVFDEIRRLKETRENFPVYAVIMDVGASGAYYIAAAADEIYADKASLVGSIGVIAAGFGFVGAMDKLGIERRLYTSGDHKAFLDPFSPENPSEKAFWNSVLDVTHQQFIAQVKLGRGDRLAQNSEVFSGLLWTGEQAVKLGLIDGLGSSSQIAREKLGTEELVNFSYQPSPWDSLVKKLGVSIGQGVASQVSQQAMTLR